MENFSYLCVYHLSTILIFIYMNKKIRLVWDWIWASCEALGEWARLGGRPF
jgi:Na+/proline symporter